MDYDFRQVEEKWQTAWERMGLFRAPREPRGKKAYVLEMFAYPSGDIHMGHFRNYTLGDCVARVRIMQGYDVLHPFGWDAFGLPAENAAIARGLHPGDWTWKNISVSRATLRRTGVGYDWDREIATCLPEYYHWNQWLFLLLYRRGIAYRARAAVNWCPSCNTVLANEQVEAGTCERCHTTVSRRELTQWFLRITAYADRLLQDLQLLVQWPDNIRAMQTYWIGRSEGAELDFPIPALGETVPVFTTRADTMCGVTFMAVAPESPLVERLIAGRPEAAAVRAYVAASLARSEQERSGPGVKEGVFSGCHAINPVNGEKIPIWVADYVLAGYGTGAVMGVPAHDERDFDFARRKGLPVRPVIFPRGQTLKGDEMGEAFVGEGIMANSGPFDGLSSPEGARAITAEAARRGWGRAKVNYRLRDWLVSRQRYWGTPIPMIHCANCGIQPVPESELPVLLPQESIDFLPKGRSPLASCDSFTRVRCPACGGPAERDPDTMDTFVDSSWYYLRYLDPKDAGRPFDPALARAWLPIDQYIGGATHATGHLLYFRFIHKVLYDEGYVPTVEPATALFNHGMVLDAEGQVMSKSVGNVVSPIDLMDEHGSDALRLAVLFAAPPDREILWTGEGLPGSIRFLRRIYRLVRNHQAALRAAPPAPPAASDQTTEEARLYRSLNHTLARVASDLDSFRHNTAIGALMEFLNELTAWGDPASRVFLYAVREFIRAMAPVAPHVAEELWQMIGGHDSVFRSGWLTWDAAALASDMVSLAVQVNGRHRAQITVSRGTSRDDVQSRALQDDRVRRAVADHRIDRVIYVPDKIVNFVLAPM